MQPRLEITTQRAQIEITTHRGSVEITQRKPQFRMRRVPAQMRIEKRAPVMHLDRTAQWKTLHIGGVLQTAQAYYQQSLSVGLEAIADIAGEGDELMRIENTGNSLADLASRRNEDIQGDLTMSMLPLPQVQWDPGYFNIQWSQHQLELEWDVSTRADIRIEPGYVEIRMVKHPEVVIRVKYDERNMKKKPLLDKYV